MELTLKPFKLTKLSTISKLFIDGIYECEILEDVVRPANEPKVFGETAIPAGTYQIIMTMSNRFNKILPLLVDVPGYEGVRIHPGNTPADTCGCLLPGKLSETVDFVAHSVIEFGKLIVKMDAALKANQHIHITITR